MFPALASWRHTLECAGTLADVWLTRGASPAAIAAIAAVRAAEFVRHARQRSPFYRALYRGRRGAEAALSRLPVVDKRALMARFDEWATDRRVTRDAVDAFLADRSRIGARFLGEYAVWKSSGTNGEPGIFVHDEGALATYDALVARALDSARLAQGYSWGLLAAGGRAALVSAVTDHYAAAANWRRSYAATSWLPSRLVSVTAPLREIVGELNAFQPALLASYPSMLALLGTERRAGRLRIAPATLWSGGEPVSPALRAQIERDFGAPLQNEYGASEALSIACECPCGWLHVNADWVVLEPVAADGTPTPAGELSDTVLLTNLANRVQPIIRYDLGDRVLVNPEPCGCGSPLPAIRVEGRGGDVLRFPDSDGRIVELLPLAIETAIEEGGVDSFQIAQVGARSLRVRLPAGTEPARVAIGQSVVATLGTLLRRHGVSDVDIALDERAPVACPKSGKRKAIVVEC